MLLVISPSKTQKLTADAPKKFTLPRFSSEVETLVEYLKGLDRNQLAGLMSLSEKLADLNWKRFQNFSITFDLENSRQALLFFQGDVFSGISAESFSVEDLDFAQNHLRIVSGLYGVLRPLDLIQPYRLEMSTKINIPDADTLYRFWGNKITEALRHDLVSDNRCVVNLASQEYFKAVRPADLQCTVLDIVFTTKKNGQYRVVAIHAKRARGLMVQFVIKNRLENIEDLKQFKMEGYSYKNDLSSELRWVFCKE